MCKSSGVSIVELLIGLVILSMIVAAGSYSLQPVTKANKKLRLTAVAHRLEDEIRRGMYYQTNYTNPAGFTIELNGTVIARAGEQRFVRHDMTASLLRTDPNFNPETYPLSTKIELVSNPALESGWGLVYQVEATESKYGVASLGTSPWPLDLSSYVTENHHTDHTIIDVPPELATSVVKKCTAGIMRGLRRTPTGSYEAVCWEYEAAAQTPDWSIPSGYKYDHANSKVILTYSKLNRPVCPNMSITDNSNKTWAIPNLYAFSQLDIRDLFPAKATGAALASTCESVISFTSYESSGRIPASIVSNATINKKPGKCPDRNLYIKNADNSCQLNFNINSIPDQLPALVGL